MYASILRTVTIAIIFLMLAVGAVMIYFRSKSITRSELWKIFKTANYLQTWVLVFVLVMSCFFGVFNRIYDKNKASVVISLNYSEASQALNSNGTRYNMADIVSNEVLKKAIKNGALEDVSVKDLKNCLTVSPSVQGDVSDKSSYHISSEYLVTYKASKKTDHLDAENVIKLVTIAYKEYYIERYTDNYFPSILSDKTDYSSMEYMDIVSYFDKEASSILNYLYGLAEEGSGFVTVNGTNFDSIAGKVYQFRETQIQENLKSLILQQSVVRDKEAYIDRLAYQNKNISFDRNKNDVSFNLCNQAIERYSEEMTRVVLVPTVDETGKYYMGRTKVGIDELSVKAADFSNRVSENDKEMMDNNLIIEKMKLAPGNYANNASADAMIETIDKNLKDFANEAISTGREFANNRMNCCMSVSIYGASFFREIKALLIFALFAYVSAMIFAIAVSFNKGKARIFEKPII